MCVRCFGGLSKSFLQGYLKGFGVGRMADIPVSCFLLSLFVLHAGIKESDTGLAPPALWDLAADKQTLQSEQPLQVAR